MAKNFISEQFSAMCRDLTNLSSLIKRLPPRYAKVAAIPPTRKGMENEPVNKIVVTEQTGREALELAAHSYRDLHINPDYSQKSARRTVGVLWFSPSRIGVADEIAATVERINAAKAGIEEFIISTYPTGQERFEALRADCPGVMTLHLYRQIRCYTNGDIDSIRFTATEGLLEEARKEELLQRIREELERSGPDYQLPLEQLIQKIASTPEPYLRERREVKVQPVANVMAAGVLKTVTAPMPLIVLQDKEVQLKLLRSFDASEQRKTRSDKAASEILGTFGGVTIESFPG
ncbi:DNA replication terminus site-binding protein (plasmid) [Enterobacter hormaechei subsp. xiangfangensis]|uniref:DNA replication terminus site-binding protein n=1 Tax=Enterobacter hormaechei TaxID=158836 RepID=UPI0018A4E210|nr:DNA replication terminus site-binding protein [Enterobacter hormaechei]QOR53600.1 DNA replication terminus site-binding protein [Enterobacter hormaechei subsp. xiangfangensis]